MRCVRIFEESAVNTQQERDIHSNVGAQVDHAPNQRLVVETLSSPFALPQSTLVPETILWYFRPSG